MSQIKNLKTDSGNVINVIDFLELQFPDAKTKYIELFLKIMKNGVEDKYSEKVKEGRTSLISLFPQKENEINKYSTFNVILLSYLFDVLYDIKVDIKTLNSFIDYNERNLVENKDLTTYRTFDEIQKQVILSEMKVEEKELEKSVVKLFEDDEWLMLKPLTYNASVKYGYGTTWCTAMDKDKSYFNKYSNEGILIYFINKKSTEKVAVYNKLIEEGGGLVKHPDITFWNTTDKQIDSFSSGLPGYVIDHLRNHFDNHKLTNSQVIDILSKQNGFKNENDVLTKKLRSLSDWGTLTIPVTNHGSIDDVINDIALLPEDSPITGGIPVTSSWSDVRMVSPSSESLMGTFTSSGYGEVAAQERGRL